MRYFVFLAFLVTLGCSAFQYVDPVTGAPVDGTAEILTNAVAAAKDSIPANPTDLVGWGYALGAGVLAAGATAARIYTKKKAVVK